MKRIVLAGVAVLAVAGLTLPASADPSICVNSSISIGGSAVPVPERICLPPEGEEGPGAPELPGLPELPEPPQP